MKKYIYNLMAACTVLLLCASCSEDEDLTTLAKVGFSAPLQATPDEVVLSTANKYQTVTSISWDDVEFPVDAPVTYQLVFDVATDTIGTTAWENAIRIQVGEDVLSRSFLGSELNNMAISLGLPMDVPGEMVVKAEATMDRTVTSKVLVLTVTPFVEVITTTQIFAVGPFQGSDPATGAPLNAIDNGVFSGIVSFPAGQLGFRLTTGPNWDQFYGNDDNGNFTEGGNNNIAVPSAGTYMITVNLITMSYTAEPYSFGVVGTATAGGWDVDTDMTFDHVNQRWTFTGNLVPGALKFRLNDGWTVNYGMNNSTEGIAYLDNQGAHTIAEAGNYTVTFKVDPDPATAVYTVTLN
jgi:starch-binding outer membrane protein SusE/F